MTSMLRAMKFTCGLFDGSPPHLYDMSVFLPIQGDLGLVGTQIFDCLLATTAKENDIKEIYMENVADFRSFEFIKAFNPFMG